MELKNINSGVFNMDLNLKNLEKTLAEHKVYDAWQYVRSLDETLGYMSISYNLLNKIYEHRKSVLDSTKISLFKAQWKREM